MNELLSSGWTELGKLFQDDELTWIVAMMWLLVVGGALLWTIHQRRRARAHLMLRAAGQLTQVTLSNVSDGVIHTDADGIVTFCNIAATKILGVPEEDILGRPFNTAVPVYKGEAQTLVENPAALWLAESRETYWDPYSGVRTADGEIKPISETISHVRDSSGNVTGAVFVFHDVSDARNLSDQLKYQARHDPLTSLPNRLAFEESLRALVKNVREQRDQAFLMYLDIDHFKIINDVHGHDVGDQLLLKVSQLLRALLGPQDQLARLGGDEFAITLRLPDAAIAQRVAEHLITKVRAYRFDINGQQFEADLSIGIVAIAADHCDPSALMARADTACYAAKDRGRGRSHLYLHDDPHIVIAERTLDCANRIQRAFDDDRFEVHLQEIVGRDRKVLGYESLIRMRSETGDLACLALSCLPCSAWAG